MKCNIRGGAGPRKQRNTGVSVTKERDSRWAIATHVSDMDLSRGGHPRPVDSGGDERTWRHIDYRRMVRVDDGGASPQGQDGAYKRFAAQITLPMMLTSSAWRS